MTLLCRRRLEEVPGVDVTAEESAGRLCQHIEDLDSISDDAVRQLCTGGHVFFNTLGTTRRIAGSAVGRADRMPFIEPSACVFNARCGVRKGFAFDPGRLPSGT